MEPKIEKIITDAKKEELTNSLLDSELSLEESKHLNDRQYLDIQERRMNGEPEAILYGQEQEMTIAKTDEEISELRKKIKEVLDGIHQK
jgi:hypothetical protein